MSGANDYKQRTASSHDAVSDSPDSQRISTEPTLTEEFTRLTQRLRRKLAVDKCILVLKRPAEDRLAAVASWNHGELSDGLAINLPHDNSLFEKVTEDGGLYTENFCGSFSGNFFERKLLIDAESRSFALQPLRHDGHLVGLVGMSSEEPMAFTLLDEGELDDILTQFAISCDRERHSI
ncbi:MAG: GAF domain-containing protein [Candidatus Zixiibacteriota bacterium]